MFSEAMMQQVTAGFYSAQCYNRATRRVFRDPQVAQLWERMGDLYAGAALFFQREQERQDAADRVVRAAAEAAIAEWEAINSWENMPCGDEV